MGNACTPARQAQAKDMGSKLMASPGKLMETIQKASPGKLKGNKKPADPALAAAPAGESSDRVLDLPGGEGLEAAIAKGLEAAVGDSKFIEKLAAAVQEKFAQDEEGGEVEEEEEDAAPAEEDAGEGEPEKEAGDAEAAEEGDPDGPFVEVALPDNCPTTSATGEEDTAAARAQDQEEEPVAQGKKGRKGKK